METTNIVIFIRKIIFLHIFVGSYIGKWEDTTKTKTNLIEKHELHAPIPYENDIEPKRWLSLLNMIAKHKHIHLTFKFRIKQQQKLTKKHNQNSIWQAFNAHIQRYHIWAYE